MNIVFNCNKSPFFHLSETIRQKSLPGPTKRARHKKTTSHVSCRVFGVTKYKNSFCEHLINTIIYLNSTIIWIPLTIYAFKNHPKDVETKHQINSTVFTPNIQVTQALLQRASWRECRITSSIGAEKWSTAQTSITYFLWSSSSCNSSNNRLCWCQGTSTEEAIWVALNICCHQVLYKEISYRWIMESCRKENKFSKSGLAQFSAGYLLSMYGAYLLSMCGKP